MSTKPHNLQPETTAVLRLIYEHDNSVHTATSEDF